jgi:adenylate kinase family enzyme
VKEKVKEKVLSAIAADSWVSDGVYLHAQDEIVARADVIIFLDIPLLVRLLNHGRRVFFEPKRHAHLSVWDEITFFREIIRRERKSRPKLLEFIKGHQKKVVTLRSRKESNSYLEHLS